MARRERERRQEGNRGGRQAGVDEGRAAGRRRNGRGLLTTSGCLDAKRRCHVRTICSRLQPCSRTRQSEATLSCMPAALHRTALRDVSDRVRAQSVGQQRSPGPIAANPLARLA
eukprot:3169271-Rhodomonas_salina.3